MSQLLDALRSRVCPGAEVSYSEFSDNRRIVVEAGVAYDVLDFLKTEYGFDMLFELTCADYLYYPDAKDRFGVVYGLLNTQTGERLLVKTWVNEPHPALRSVVPLWSGAEWMEREVFDMYGVRFEGHPDLRRILMPDEFVAFPLRKDYPLRGRGERHNFPVIARADG